MNFVFKILLNVTLIMVVVTLTHSALTLMGVLPVPVSLGSLEMGSAVWVRCWDVLCISRIIISSSDVEECAVDNGGCVNAACTNTVGSFTCDCYTGYSRVDEITCQGNKAWWYLFNFHILRNVL